MGRTHLFLALASAPWGELLYAIRAANQLIGAGDAVCFLAPGEVEAMLQGTQISFVPLEPRGWLAQIDRVLAAQRCASLVLVDIAITYTYLEAGRMDAGFVHRFAVPVIGLDVWNLASTNLLMERGTTGWMLSSHSRDVTRRLIPSPMIRPTGWADPLAAGLFASIDPAVPSPDTRGAIRAQMGLDECTRLIVFPTAAWQQPDADPTDPYVARLTRRLPALLAGHLARLPPDVHVLHVGVRDIPELAAALGPRYRRLPQLPRQAFLDVIAAADLLLSLNAMATTLGAAAQLGVPILLGTNAHGGATVEELAAGLPFSLTPRVREQLATLVPLHPFRVWPFGLFRFTQPIVENNLCISMARPFEVLDEDGFCTAATEMLSNEDAIADARARMASCVAAVRTLPSAVDVFAHHLGVG